MLTIDQIIDAAVSGTDEDPAPRCTGPCGRRAEYGLTGADGWVCEDCAHQTPRHVMQWHGEPTRGVVTCAGGFAGWVAKKIDGTYLSLATITAQWQKHASLDDALDSLARERGWEG